MSSPAYVDSKPVTDSQIDRIRDLSDVVLDDRDVFLEVTGLPENRGDASAMLGAFHAVRSRNKPVGHLQRQYADVITDLRDQPKPLKGDQPVAATDTKTCKACGETKPTTEFGRNKALKDGLQPKCGACYREYQRQRLQKRKAAASGPQTRPQKTQKPPVGPDRNPEGEDAAARQQPTGQASPSDLDTISVKAAVYQILADPPLSKLRLLAEFLDTDLNGAASFCTTVTVFLKEAADG